MSSLESASVTLLISASDTTLKQGHIILRSVQ